MIAAHEADRLVLFCGAGVSAYAGLPLFPGLVDKVIAHLRPDLPGSVEAERCAGNYDRVLNYLEVTHPAGVVRAEVMRILSSPTVASRDTHRAILTLATNRDGLARLVTTNFDRLFDEVGFRHESAIAPRLPVPKRHKWNSVVHMHGKIDDTDPDGTQLVLTSADFGTAYLVERWASRFVTELFQNFTVLFLGYGINDPVMRYLMDALSAERARGVGFESAFALTPEEEGAQEAWKLRGVDPIFYEKTPEHHAFHNTLRAWAEHWSGGLEGRVRVVRDLSKKSPSAIGQSEKDRLCWAVADEIGARALAATGRDARIDWLRVFDEGGLTASFLAERSRQPRPTDPAQAEALQPERASTPLVGTSASRPPPLDAVRFWIARWAAKHANDPRLVDWVVEGGVLLHPIFADEIRREVQAASFESLALRRVWLALTGSVPIQGGTDAFREIGLNSRAANEDWLPSVRGDVLRALSPCLRVHPGWRRAPAGLEADVEGTEEIRIGSVMRFDCELRAGDATEMLLGALRARPDCTKVLADLALEITTHLRTALEYAALLDRASRDSDTSFIEHPSIEDHAQNRHHHGWTHLIDLARDAFLALMSEDVSRGHALVQHWRSIEFPLFRRLVLLSGRHGGFSDPRELMRLLIGDSQLWLWASEIQRELFATLPRLWIQLPSRARSHLARAILAGPPRQMFRADLSADEWRDVRDHSIWKRLARIHAESGDLPARARDRLISLEQANPGWRLSGSDLDDFPWRMETRWGHAHDFSQEQFNSFSDDEVLRLLTEHMTNRGGLLERWESRIQSDYAFGTRVLHRALLEHPAIDREVWAHAFPAFAKIPENSHAREGVLAFLEQLPESLWLDERVVGAAVRLLRTYCDSPRDDERPRVLSIWDRLLEPALVIDHPTSDERVTDAINHPAGTLTEGLLAVLQSRTLERNEGLPADVIERLSGMLDPRRRGARHAGVILSSRLPYLFDVDPEWSKANVIPLLSWSDADRAQGAWQGFLWSPVLRPSLFAALKSHFLESFDHLVALGRHDENLAALLAAVSIEGFEAISATEARECLRKLRDGRGHVAFWLYRLLEDVGDRAEQLWNAKIGPWLGSVWPRDTAGRDEDSSVRLALIAIRSRGGFKDAVGRVAPLIGPVEHGFQVLDELAKGGGDSPALVDQAPLECLRLLDAITPDAPPSWFGPLGDILDSIRNVDASLAERSEFKRLRAVALRIGL